MFDLMLKILMKSCFVANFLVYLRFPASRSSSVGPEGCFLFFHTKVVVKETISLSVKECLIVEKALFLVVGGVSRCNLTIKRTMHFMSFCHFEILRHQRVGIPSFQL